MRIIYKRNTHDDDDEYRGVEYFGMIDIQERLAEAKINGIVLTESDIEKWREHNKSFESQELFFGVHTFSKKKEMDFEQIYQETFKLLHGGALCGTYDPKDPRLTIEGHLKSLAFMIDHKLIKAEIMVA